MPKHLFFVFYHRERVCVCVCVGRINLIFLLYSTRLLIRMPIQKEQRSRSQSFIMREIFLNLILYDAVCQGSVNTIRVFFLFSPYLPLCLFLARMMNWTNIFLVIFFLLRDEFSWFKLGDCMAVYTPPRNKANAGIFFRKDKIYWRFAAIELFVMVIVDLEYAVVGYLHKSTVFNHWSWIHLKCIYCTQCHHHTAFENIKMIFKWFRNSSTKCAKQRKRRRNNEHDMRGKKTNRQMEGKKNNEQRSKIEEENKNEASSMLVHRR